MATTITIDRYGSKRDWTIPSSWDELNARQYRRLAPLFWGMANLSQADGGQGDTHTAGAPLSVATKKGLKVLPAMHGYKLRVVAFWVLLDIRWWELGKLLYWFLIGAETMKAILFPDEDCDNPLDFIMGAPPTANEVLPYLITPKGVFKGPGNKMMDLSIVELAFAETNYHKWRQGNAEALDKLVGILYRNRRRPFTAKIAGKSAKHVKGVSRNSKLAIATFYLGYRAYLGQRYPKFFSDSKDPKLMSGKNWGWAGILDEVAGGKFGDLNSTTQYPAETVLIHLEREIEKNELREAELDKQRKRR